MTLPTLLVTGVAATDESGPRGRPRGYLSGLQLSLSAGVYAVLGAPEDGLCALSEVLGLVRSPARGQVRVRGEDPFREPRVRAGVGALLPEARLPDARRVEESVARAMVARGQSPAPSAVLEPLGLMALSRRTLSSLSFAEGRAVELALALSTPSPSLVVLHEPCADVAGGQGRGLGARLREIAAGGAVVIVATSSPADARSLGDTILVLHRGAIVRHGPGDGSWLVPDTPQGPAWVELVAWVSSGARSLTAGLAAKPEVSSVMFEGSRHGEGSDAGTVRVRARDASDGALALSDTAVAVGAVVDSIAAMPPTLGEVRAASQGLLLSRLSPQVAHRPLQAAGPGPLTAQTPAPPTVGLGPAHPYGPATPLPPAYGATPMAPAAEALPWSQGYAAPSPFTGAGGAPPAVASPGAPVPAAAQPAAEPGEPPPLPSPPVAGERT